MNLGSRNAEFAGMARDKEDIVGRSNSTCKVEMSETVETQFA